jgi:hypothetical protein
VVHVARERLKHRQGSVRRKPTSVGVTVLAGVRRRDQGQIAGDDVLAVDVLVRVGVGGVEVRGQGNESDLAACQGGREGACASVKPKTRPEGGRRPASSGRRRLAPSGAPSLAGSATRGIEAAGLAPASSASLAALARRTPSLLKSSGPRFLRRGRHDFLPVELRPHHYRTLGAVRLSISVPFKYTRTELPRLTL